MRNKVLVLVLVSWLVGTLAGQGEAAEKVHLGEPSPAVLSRYGLETAWTAQAVINPARDHLAQLTLDEELVYAQGTNGVLTAFDAETGRRQWAVRLGRFDEPTFPPVSNEGMVLAVVGHSMYGIDKLKGDIKWSLRIPGPPSTGPAIDESQIYVGTLDGSVYAFSIRRIEKLYLERRLPQWSHDTLVWRYQAAKEITSPPLPVGRTVNFAARDGSLYAVTTNRPKLMYQFETDAPIVAPMAYVGDVQFLASEDFTFYAINANTGKVLWEFVTGLPIRKSPFAIGDVLYLSPDRGGVFCLSVTDGGQRWWKPFLTDFVTASHRVTYARDVDGNLALIDTNDGSLLGRIPAFAYPRHIHNDRTDRIYLATDSGHILALREKGRDIPNFHKYPERRPIQPEFAPEEGEAEGSSTSLELNEAGAP
jgi:outer membrane protein assembly factor BamB